MTVAVVIEHPFKCIQRVRLVGKLLCCISINFVLKFGKSLSYDGIKPF